MRWKPYDFNLFRVRKWGPVSGINELLFDFARHDTHRHLCQVDAGTDVNKEVSIRQDVIHVWFFSINLELRPRRPYSLNRSKHDSNQRTCKNHSVIDMIRVTPIHRTSKRFIG